MGGGRRSIECTGGARGNVSRCAGEDPWWSAPPGACGGSAWVDGVRLGEPRACAPPL